ncbi:MAG: RluA family pseudouridine synthase [Patescibacteria group bacterium]|nr:RluA family pseudouridine synthase [Patescibacteria group bacterium]
MSNEILGKVQILYEDADCAVLDKPAGLMVHSDAKNDGPFLTDWIVERFPEAKGVGESITTKDGEEMSRDGIVHRLDRETSGAIIIAKTQAGFASLKKQFQDRSVKKKYLAFVWGELKEEFGTINKPIARSGSDFRKWSAGRGRRGEEREAETYWTRIWTGQAQLEKFTLIEAEPKTGRTHQIRVHFVAIQHPVVSDSLYAGSKPRALGFERLALHSRTIAFVTMAGAHIQISAPLPEDFRTACHSLGIDLPEDGDKAD